MQNFVKHLKKEEEEEQNKEQEKKKPRVIKLPDPTVFTISSPSAWQKRNLSSPPIFPVELRFQGIRKWSQINEMISVGAECEQSATARCDLALSPPQLATEDEDCVNKLQQIR